MNNNYDLDNGVYNKFMQSSRASFNFSPSKAGDDGLSGGDSLQKSFEKPEKDIDVSSVQDLDSQIDDEVEVDLLKVKLDQERKQRGELTDFERITQDAQNNNIEKEVIDNNIVADIIEFGYPKEHIEKSIADNEVNYATASYYLLKKRQMIDNSAHLFN